MIEVKLAELGVALKDLFTRLALASLNLKSKRNIARLNRISLANDRQRMRLDLEENEIEDRKAREIARAKERAKATAERIALHHAELEQFDNLSEDNFRSKEDEIATAYSQVRSMQ